MFDAVIGEARRPRRRFGPAMVAAVVLHGAGVAVAAGIAAAPAEERREVEVTFVRPAAQPPRPSTAEPAPAPAPAPAPRPRRAPPQRAEAPATVLPQAIVAPTTMPPEPVPSAAPAGAVSDLAGAAGEEVAAVPGGVSGPVVDESEAPAAEFDVTRMSPPVKLSGPDPRYTPDALAREIEGAMAVKCVVTVDGAVRDCRVVRGLPFMDGAVVEALERRRYRPATLAGVPVEVDYTFRITMRLP